MLFSFLKKQKKRSQQKKILETMIASLTMAPEQKSLYFQALEVVNDTEMDELYQNIIRFVEKIEIRELEEISKDNFGTIAGMRKKEAHEKMQEMNSFSFLLHNL